MKSVESAVPTVRVSRSPKVVDSFVTVAFRKGNPDATNVESTRALAEIGRLYAGWPELDALKAVLERRIVI